ncbi:MAG: DUF4282 domain-containing protein [Alphaproteobacteria bacterium]|nr:DUF4282 domain-containing protein [Alphaproteobacteria bacterium]
MDFGDFFSFDKRLAPQLVKPIYWIGSVLIILYGVWGFIYYGFGNMLVAPLHGIWFMIAAVFYVIASVLALRIATEVTLAVFEMHEKLGAGPAATTSTSTPN